MRSRPFPARHPGICGDSACGTRFNVGDLIGYDNHDTIVCVDCLRGDLKPAEKVCPTCNLIHAGKCDEW